MPLSATEQALYDFAKGALPRLLFASSRSEEELHAFVKVFDAAYLQIAAYFEQALIASATGAGADYLNQHARDRGTARRDGESDVALRDRLRSIEDALTRESLLAAAQSILDAESIAGTAAMVELPRDAGFFIDTVTADAGTGGTFSDASDLTNPDRVKFEPDTPFAFAPYRPFEEARTYKLIASGALSAGNDGTFEVVGIDGDGVLFDNASAVFEVDATVAWTIGVYDRDDNRLDGYADSYFGKLSGGTTPCDRFSSEHPSIITILPINTTAAIAAAVAEAIRMRKAAGVVSIVEYRQP